MIKKIPFFTNKYQDESYGSKIRQKIDEIIKSGIFILGNEVIEFENSIAKFLNIKHAIGVANGSDALYLALMVLDLPAKSEVITTPFSFLASSSCISRNNLKPVFVDVDYTYNIDVNKIEEKITENTSCILPVDLFSHTPDYDKINEIAKKYKLKIVEDSAEAFGMKWKSEPAGVLGDIGVFSFFPTKTLGAFGDGGMILTNNDEYAEKLRLLRIHGANKKYHHKYLGINSRLDALQAGILNVKLKYIKDEIRERYKIADKYFALLKNIEQVRVPKVINYADPVWYVFSILCENRDELQLHLKENGIGTSVYYPRPMHLQECFRYLGYKEGDFPIAEELCKKSLALPVFIGLNDEMIQYVCDTINNFYRK